MLTYLVLALAHFELHLSFCSFNANNPGVVPYYEETEYFSSLRLPCRFLFWFLVSIWIAHSSQISVNKWQSWINVDWILSSPECSVQFISLWCCPFSVKIPWDLSSGRLFCKVTVGEDSGFIRLHMKACIQGASAWWGVHASCVWSWRDESASTVPTLRTSQSQSMYRAEQQGVELWHSIHRIHTVSLSTADVSHWGRRTVFSENPTKITHPI